MGEELDGLNVGIGVDDAAGHFGARIGLTFRHPVEPRHEGHEDHRVERQPADEGQHHPPVGGDDEDNDTGEVDRHIEEHVDRLDDGLAHGERRLHQLLGNPSGELVLVEAHGVAEQPAMHRIAKPHGQAAEDGLEVHQPVDQLDAGHDDENQHGKAQELPTAIDPEGRGVGVAEPVDDVAEKAEQRDLDHRDRCGHHSERKQCPAVGPREVPKERAKGTGRRRRDGRLRKRIDHPFEKGEHEDYGSSAVLRIGAEPAGLVRCAVP